MWTRSSLKEAAKMDLSRSYWGVVVMSLIMGVIKGGGSGSGGGGSSSNSQSIRDNLDGLSSVDMRAIMAIIAVVATIVLVAVLVGAALSIFLLNPLSVGGHRYFIEATYEARTVGDIKCLGMCFASGRYGNIVKTLFLKGLYQWLWSLLLVIPGIVKGYEYRMIPYILAENPDVTSSEAFALSKEMMNGEKWNAFVLDLSFIGWIILSVFTCGILSVFYVNPYVNLTNAHLYETLKSRASVDYFDRSLGGNGFGQIEDSYTASSPYDSYQSPEDDPFNGSIE